MGRRKKNLPGPGRASDMRMEDRGEEIKREHEKGRKRTYERGKTGSVSDMKRIGRKQKTIGKNCTIQPGHERAQAKKNQGRPQKKSSQKILKPALA